MEVYKFFLDILFRADSRQRYFDSVLNTFTGETSTRKPRTRKRRR